jgi:hypothetical protein
LLLLGTVWLGSARVAGAPANARNRPVNCERARQVLGASVSAARNPGADEEAILVRPRKLRRRRFGQRFGGLPSSAAFRNEWLVAGSVGALQFANVDLPAPSRDHARAPPAANQPA